MITYVNTVLVGKGMADLVEIDDIKDIATEEEAKENVGKFIVNEVDDKKFRVGLVTGTHAYMVKDGEGELDEKFANTVRWSNDIVKSDIKSYTVTPYEDSKSSEDKITIDFSGVNTDDLAGKRIVLRLTFKDTPTRFRKWTESYEITVNEGDDAAKIAKKFKSQIIRNAKRARVYVKAEDDTLVLTAMEYTDDNSVDSISPANKVRFSASMWMTDPQAAGFASKNKYSVDGAVITKEPGFQQVGEAKLVRDAEAQAMGYMGILNRGECTWPIIKPEMNVDLSKTYDTLTLEFENMYRAADDIFRKTKQTLQIFEEAGKISAVQAAIEAIFNA